MKIGIYMIGSLGDTLAALPALWALRHHYRDDQLILISDQQTDTNRVGPLQILDGIDLLDSMVQYPSDETASTLAKSAGVWRLYSLLRQTAPDILVYLLRGTRDQTRIPRDMAFFRLAGIRRIIGMEGMPEKGPGRKPPVLPVTSQADQFLWRLAAAGIPVPPPGQGRCDLGLKEQDHARFREWAERLPIDGGRPWVAFAPGSKMPSKRWPEEHFAETGKALIASHDIWPVVFGGPEDRAVGERLLARWGRGYLAAGPLGVRAAAAALGRCALYVGNDTGTMHLAASAGTRCVALFSSRDFPGLWDPYGTWHIVLRTDPPCAGCFGITCPRGDNLCLASISARTVSGVCQGMLDRTAAAGGRAR
jgi:ADP-heptose:LPS heptosyltransferase